ncbi:MULTISPECIES: TolC family outer membrane protein [Vibrio]|uniref:TolC family outer membrane protein n=1 Tax=Vibrio TaxID=662 RepID=UPI00102D9615|nr:MULTISPECIES: TolC family outer membrane protein [Vibrio]EGQ9715620.1 TolC family outer membrane protein [Vibrio alginolyticus]EGR2551997.1 agglutination protein [Vibrio alginolyticus]EII3281174.1 TolC family outer membrane protein [Vibrio alginolyticus]MCA2468885.1 TolC family outer membrane protein [Vibrio alginolyticus]MDW1540743.1 TolC family outer membrane protein [Vibrio sp. YT-17]
MRLKSTLLVLFAVSSSPNALTLEESVTLSLDSSPSLLARYSRYESMVRDRNAINGSFLPQVNLYAAAGYEGTRYNNGNYIDSEDRTLERTEMGVRISQLLFDGFKTSADVDRLSYEAEAERLGLLASAENVALDTVRAYVDVLHARELMKLTERNLNEHQEIYRFILDKKEKGLTSNSDLAQVSSRVATTQSSLIAAQNNLSDARTRFVRLVGRAPQNLVEPVYPQELLPNKLDEALKQAVRLHPSIQSAMKDLEAARHEVKREKGDYYPELKLELSANKTDNVDNIEGINEDAKVMLTVNYDLFNGFSTDSRVESSAWRVEEARAIRANAELDANEGVRLAWDAHTLLQQQMEYLKVNVDAAKVTELGYIQQFNVGRRSLLDVLDAKVETFVARRNYTRTKYDHLVATYRLFNSMGILTYALRVEYPENWKENNNG